MKSDVQINIRAKEAQRALIDTATGCVDVKFRFHSGNNQPLYSLRPQL